MPILAKSLQLHNLPVDGATELFKPLKDSVSLLVCNEKTCLGFLLADVISGLGLGLYGQGKRTLAPTAAGMYFAEVFSAK